MTAYERGDEVWIINSRGNRAHHGTVTDAFTHSVFVRNDDKDGQEGEFSADTGLALGMFHHRDGTEAWTDTRRPRIVPLDHPDAAPLRQAQDTASLPQQINEALKKFRLSADPGDYTDVLRLIAEWGAAVFAGAVDPKADRTYWDGEWGNVEFDAEAVPE